VPEDDDDAPGNGANFRRRLSVSASNQGLAAFGVAPECGTAYLLDREIARIVGEGQAGPIRAVVRAWDPVAPGRYTVVTANDADPAVLLEWQRFKAYNQYWVISDES